MVENAVLHLLQPVFVAVLSPLVLDERLRRSAMVALAVAITGSLVALRPDRALQLDTARTAQLLAMIAGVAAALFSASAHMMVRKASASDTPERVVFWFTVACSVVAGLASFAGGDGLGLPDGLDLAEGLAEIAAMAGLGLAGQLAMTRAYGRAMAPMVAIVAYASIPVSVVLDLVAWGAAPTLDAVLGSLLMIVAGVILARRT
jgi:S-adenosylmethionine uptake transporter